MDGPFRAVAALRREDVRNLRSSLLGVALVSVFATPAHAASSASASLGPLTLRLIDLAPGDGLTPWIAFHDSAYNNLVSAYAFQRLAAEDRQSALTGNP